MEKKMAVAERNYRAACKAMAGNPGNRFLAEMCGRMLADYKRILEFVSLERKAVEFDRLASAAAGGQ
jgi:hypothetical protein